MRIKIAWDDLSYWFVSGFPTGSDEAVAHAGPEQWNQTTRHAWLRGWLQQVGKGLFLGD